jgi:adenosine deaminase
VLALVVLDAIEAAAPPWVAELPSAGAAEIRTSASFSDEEMAASFAGCREVTERRGALKAQFEAAWAVVQAVAKGVDAGSDAVAAGVEEAAAAAAVTKCELLRAFEIVWSRAFEVELNGDPHLFLLPAADMLNHTVSTEHRTSIHWDGHDHFEIRAPQRYAVGDHVFISYGPKPNADLAASYAFALDHNPFDEASVAVPQPSSSVGGGRGGGAEALLARLSRGAVPWPASSAAASAPRFNLGWAVPLGGASDSAGCDFANDVPVYYPTDFLWSCRAAAGIIGAAASTAGMGSGTRQDVAGFGEEFDALGALGVLSHTHTAVASGPTAAARQGEATKLARMVQAVCTTELERFATSLWMDEVRLAQLRCDNNSGGNSSDGDGSETSDGGSGSGGGGTATAAAADQCGLLVAIGIKRVLHAAIEQAWVVTDAAKLLAAHGRGDSAAVASGEVDQGGEVTLAWCQQQLPKVELHAHLNGSLDAGAIRALLSDPINADAAAEHCFLAKVQIAGQEQRSLSECFALFDVVHRLTRSADMVYLATRHVVAGFAADRVRYLELRTTPRANPQTGMSKQDYLEAVLRAISDQRGGCSLNADCPAPVGTVSTGDVDGDEAVGAGGGIVVRLILSINRRGSVADANSTVDLAITYRRRGVVAIDLSGDPTKGDSAAFVPALARARQHGLKLALHVAEVDWPADTGLLLAVRPDRIGHGTHIGGGGRAVPPAARGVPFEICLTSNLKCGTVPTLAEHHLVNLYRRGHPLTVCTDDSGVFDTTLSKEYVAAATVLKLSRRATWQMAYDSIGQIFAGDAIKSSLRAQFVAEAAGMFGP